MAAIYLEAFGGLLLLAYGAITTGPRLQRMFLVVTSWATGSNLLMLAFARFMGWPV